MSKLPTERQLEIYDFIRMYVDENGYSPSLTEIGKKVGLKSKSTVFGHLERMEQKKMIKRVPGIPRSISIIK